MIELRIDNSDCSITNLNIAQHKELSGILSYTLNPQSRFFAGGYGPTRQSLLTKKGSFPTGLLYLVTNWIKKHKLSVQTIDFRIAPMNNPNLFIANFNYEPYKEQIEAANKALQFGRGIIVAPTGVGKSLIIALIIQKVSVPTLIVVPNLELKRQLTLTLQEIFGKNFVTNKIICVKNIDSLSAEDCVNYDCVIIDEFHHSGAKTYRQLNKKAWKGIYYKFGVTATPFRSQDNERLLLESVLSNVIYEISYQDAVNYGYIVPMEAYYIEIPKYADYAKLGNNWHQVYSELVVNNKVRNNIIIDLLKTLKDEGKSALCLVKEIAHGEILSKGSNIMFANGQNEDSTDMIKFFSQNKLKNLIGTNGILGEGVDTKPAEFIIIAGLGKSKNQFMQQVGRGFRNYEDKTSCKIILIKDNSHKWTREHFKEQCKILLNEYNITPLKINL